MAAIGTDRTGGSVLHSSRRVCVFAGSQIGVRPIYVQIARDFGRIVSARGLGLVYGGSTRGLMGAVAAGVREGGGEVIGVMPEGLMTREAAKPTLGDLRIVGSMHERKASMSALADAFVALPGGFGTLDELFEILTWAQLGLHTKPIGLLNVNAYFDPLLALVKHAVSEGFVAALDADLLMAGTEPELLLSSLLGASSANCAQDRLLAPTVLKSPFTLPS